MAIAGSVTTAYYLWVGSDGVVCLDSAETYYICNGNTMIEVYGKEAAVLALTQAWLEEAVR